jgi:NDP-hexose-3-ketoreductase
MAANRIGLGVLGCADVAARRVLPAVAATAGITLTAVASRTPAKAQAFATRFGAAAVHGYDRLLAREDVDAVYLPLPSGLHGHWIARSLAAGKHVLAEKPLTTELDETARLVVQARRAGLVLRENYMFVHHRQHDEVRRRLADGQIGGLRSFAATFAIPARAPDDIRYRRELGGGALLDVGGYPLRAALHFLGPDLEVAGASLSYDERLGVDVAGGVLLRRADGVTAQLTFGLDHRYTSAYQLLGSTGSLSVDHVFTTPAHHQPVIRLDRQERGEQVVLASDDQYTASVAAFVHAVERGDLADDTILAQADLLHRCRLAAGRPSSPSSSTTPTESERTRHD